MRSFYTYMKCFNHFKLHVYMYFLWYIIRNKNKEDIFCMAVSVFFKCDIMQEKSSFILYFKVIQCVLVWGCEFPQRSQSKFTVLDSFNKASSWTVNRVPPQWNFTIPPSNGSINLALIQYEGGGWENNLFYNLSPGFRFHNFFVILYM